MVAVKESGYDVASVLEKAHGLRVSIERWGITRRLRDNQIAVLDDNGEIDESVGAEMRKAQKVLIVSPEYLALKRVGGAMKDYLKLMCLPSPFGAGIFMVPKVYAEQVDEQCMAYEASFEAKKVEFGAKYVERVQEARERLGSAWEAKDYPPVEQVLAECSLEFQWVNFGTPESLNSRIFRREQEKAAAQVAEWREEMHTLMRASMADLVGHLVERLTGEREGGKPKIFKDSAVTNVAAFLETFEARNLMGDQELAAQVDAAKSLLKGVDAEQLRDNANMRKTVASGFSSIKSLLDEMMKDAPRRKLDLSDD